MLKSGVYFAFFFFNVSLFAQNIGVNFDPAKTQIQWSLAGNVHTTHGTFHLKQGRIGFDLPSGVIKGELVADATTGESGNGARDRRMNKEVLESEKYQEFRFTPQKMDGSVSLTGKSTVRVSGEFTIHGARHNLTIPMDVVFNNGVVTSTGKFSVPYVEWGMKDPSNFLFKVDKSVEVEITAVGRVTAQ